ncbi:MAG: hypothetical protein K0S74_212 [Chlamydiales bacterium]|jgi:hypothetical protein|nr:hypothetical protein [Chlamydiales bacterium]
MIYQLKIYSISLIAILFINSLQCYADLPPPHKKWYWPPQKYYIGKYQAEHVEQMEKVYHYTPFLITAHWGDKIYWLRMYYEGQEANDVSQARKMIVESTDWYLKLLNDSNEIKELITTPTFGLERLQLRWTFRQLDNDQLFIRGNYVAMATLRDGIITYERFNEEIRNLEVILQEPYEEARHLVPSPSSSQ